MENKKTHHKTPKPTIGPNHRGRPKITESTEHKNYVANYFEDLYQAREGSTEFEAGQTT